MKKIFLIAAASIALFACNSNKKEEAKTGGTDTTGTKMENKMPAQAEFADAKYTDWGKKMLKQFESGDIDGWLSNYADNARYVWSSGDSLVGKKAISDYWMNRRKNVIDSIQFTNDIWLAIKVNTSQKGPDLPGVWVMTWYQVNVKYKNGKKLGFWVHNLNHYDNNDKVDETASYIDRAPINKALGMK